MKIEHENRTSDTLRAERISNAVRDKYRRQKTAQRQLGWLIFVAFIGFIVCLFSTASHARELVYMPNKAGGEIVLTDSRSDVCPAGTHIAVSRTREGDTLMGCWAYSSPYVYVKWADGELSMFKLADFLPFKRSARDIGA